MVQYEDDLKKNQPQLPRMQATLINILLIHDNIELQIQASARLRDENWHVQPGQSTHLVRVPDGS